MPTDPATPFDAETREFFLSELHEMGAGAIVHGLESVLLVEAGEIVSVGSTDEMTDGSAAAILAAAESVAIVLGCGRPDEDPEVLEALRQFEDELKDTPGLADLALKAIEVLAVPNHPRFGRAKGTASSRAVFLKLYADVHRRVSSAHAKNPEEYELLLTGEGAIKVTFYAEGADV